MTTQKSNGNWPSITIVTPSFNQGAYLERTIQSVLAQSCPAVEYIIVDGGSSDNSPALIQKYSDSLHWWCIEPDAGQADAIAKGFAHSSGEILCWLNSDDLLLPGALLAVARYFHEHPEAEVVNGGAYCIDAHDRPICVPFQSTYTHGVRASALRFRFYGQDGVYQPATFWRRSAYIEVGGVRQELSFAMDLDLFTRLASRRRFHVIRDYLACFRVHDASKSSSLQEVRRAEVRAVQFENGVHDASPLRRFVLYGWYRATSLLRKLILQVRLFVGVEQFPALPDLADSFRVKPNAKS